MTFNALCAIYPIFFLTKTHCVFIMFVSIDIRGRNKYTMDRLSIRWMPCVAYCRNIHTHDLSRVKSMIYIANIIITDYNFTY